jgi:hypothetical protein
MTTDAGPYAVRVPITDGLRLVNFFNGRLLSGEDLQREQTANRALRDRLGRAVGDGVVEGLTVRVAAGNTANVPLVTVSAGTAINRNGTTLELPAGVEVSLARPSGADTAAAAEAAARAAGRDFASCSGLAAGAPFTASGVYLLTIRPIGAPVGRAPVSGLGNETAGCDTDATAEGVSFELLHLDLEPALLADVAHLRNRLAHLLLGTTDPRRTHVAIDPFGPAPTGYGLLDDLRPNCLFDDEVPLAVVFWTPGPGIRFVDMWSVRRRITRRSDSDDDRRAAEGEARLRQFQEELADLRTAVAPETLRAIDHFRLLPPAGFLPLGTSAGNRGFGFREFFTGRPYRGPSLIDATHVDDLLRESFRHDPIDLAEAEVLWLYLVRQNQDRPYVLFTTAHLPWRADARFDLARWNSGSFAELG